MRFQRQRGARFLPVDGGQIDVLMLALHVAPAGVRGGQAPVDVAGGLTADALDSPSCSMRRSLACAASGITEAVAVQAGDNITLRVQGMGSTSIRFV